MSELTDDFIKQIADEYREHYTTGKPSVVIGQLRGVPARTVQGWIGQARKRGFLPAGTPGRATIDTPEAKPMSAAQLVGAHFHRLRKEAGMSLQQAGDRMTQRTNGAPWSRQAVSAGEKGRRAWAADDVVAAAQLFGVAPGIFFEPLPPCTHCGGNPPAGYACTHCGAEAGD